MKIAIVYNRESKAVINLFGTLNREKYGLETIRNIKDGLVAGGHQVKTFEGDKNIISKLEEFMPSVVSGERPGLVFNLSYGIQGKGRYMHVPGILEMIGVPYVGSGPETHALALDKVVTKMILIQKGLPTPKFTVMDNPDSPADPSLQYPLIVKPKDEAVSFGLRIVHNEAELREGVQTIYETFHSPTLVEEYIDGREVNVGLLGNNPVQALPPVELVFGEGEQIFTYEDKKNKSGRTVEKVCPAPLSEEQTQRVQQLAIDTFNALGCYDSARVDFRIDKDGNPYILEVNSMASLGADGSFVFAAEKMGLSYADLMNRIIDITCERYFGPYFLDNNSGDGSEKNKEVFNSITNKRDKIESDLKAWTNLSSRTEDPVGLNAVRKKLDDRLKKLNLKRSEDFTNRRSAWTWETKAGFKDGTLLVVPIDVPGERSGFPIPFRTEQEWIFGEGVAASRGGLVTILSALSALKDHKLLQKKKVGIFFYSDEGRGMRYSSDMLYKASRLAKEVIVLQPGFLNGKISEQRRGSKKFSVIVEGDPQRVGKHKQLDVLSYFIQKAEKLKEISSDAKKLTVALQDVHSERHSVLLPHRVNATITVTYIDEALADNVEDQIRNTFKTNSSEGMITYVEKIEDRPPLLKKKNNPITKKLRQLSKDWNIPFGSESSLLSTAAGEVTSEVSVICGFAPASKGLYTPNEAIHRRELIERSLLLALYLMDQE
ncbi:MULTISPECIES: M20/M25/M40 family metallo-hydrolase [Bacillaceae]|uniref:M20/M25/M40 family metallo-hydrolase n=1 Tax=Evansella alkalicola TaxID=745819 RepID=A0ABS6JZ48_9BACI|nr:MULTISPECIES: M20/M25/M40 family metallo-hydrolase [Bacillaceae]MBU9723685.1 M20/M25/M40 family metallo-hydrolase [Bacillus alkalicola]